MLDKHDKIQAGAGELGTLGAFLKDRGSSHHHKRENSLSSLVPVEKPADHEEAWNMASKGGDASILGLKEPFEKRSIHTQTMGRRSASFQTTMNPTLHFPDEGHQKEENLDKDCRVRVAEKTKKSSESRALPRQEPPIATFLTSSLSLQEKTHLKTTTDMLNTVGLETQSTKKALSQQRPRGSEDTTLQYHGQCFDHHKIIPLYVTNAVHQTHRRC